jgi:hypothetical protein
MTAENFKFLNVLSITISFYLLLFITIEFDKHPAKMIDHQPLKFKNPIITITYH